MLSAKMAAILSRGRWGHKNISRISPFDDFYTKDREPFHKWFKFTIQILYKYVLLLNGKSWPDQVTILHTKKAVTSLDHKYKYHSNKKFLKIQLLSSWTISGISPMAAAKISRHLTRMFYCQQPSDDQCWVGHGWAKIEESMHHSTPKVNSRWSSNAVGLTCLWSFEYDYATHCP